MKRMVLLLMILVATVGLSACGQSGPLYFPGKKTPQKHENNNQNVGNQISQDLDAVE